MNTYARHCNLYCPNNDDPHFLIIYPTHKWNVCIGVMLKKTCGCSIGRLSISNCMAAEIAEDHSFFYLSCSDHALRMCPQQSIVVSGAIHSPGVSLWVGYQLLTEVCQVLAIQSHNFQLTFSKVKNLHYSYFILCSLFRHDETKAFSFSAKGARTSFQESSTLFLPETR